MCGRYTLVDVKSLAERFDVDNVNLEFQASLNIAPGTDLPVIVQQNEKRLLQEMRWGLVPHWASDPKIGYRMINARSETVAQKPAFRESLRTTRCLVPANGFYEWKKQDHKNQPYYFSLAKNELMAFAGLWGQWQNNQGATLKTFTILTKAADEVVSEAHERMPVILAPDQENEWLTSKNPIELLHAIQTSKSESRLTSTIVTADVNKL